MEKNINRKNILIVLNNLEYGGATRINQEITHIFDKANYYVLAGDLVINNNLDKEFKNSTVVKYKPITKSNFLLYISTILNTYINIFKIFKKTKIDLVILNLPYSSFGALLNPLLWNKKKVSIFHGALCLEKRSEKEYFSKKLNIIFELKNYIDYLMQKLVLSTSNDIIVFSKYSKKLLEQTFSFKDKGKLHILPPPIKLKSAPQTQNNYESITFLIASRIEPRKGLHTLLEAIRILKMRHNVKHFNVICVGPIQNMSYAYSLFKKCYDLDIFTHITFKPSLDRELLYKNYYQTADCLIMPSVKLETLGLVTLESLSMGVPVIAFDKSATPEILARVDKNLIIKKVSPEHLANKMEWFMNLDGNSRQRLRNMSIQGCRNFVNKEKFVTNFTQII